jgi:PAS domain S-box-containing protein
MTCPVKNIKSNPVSQPAASSLETPKPTEKVCSLRYKYLFQNFCIALILFFVALKPQKLFIPPPFLPYIGSISIALFFILSSYLFFRWVLSPLENLLNGKMVHTSDEIGQVETKLRQAQNRAIQLETIIDCSVDGLVAMDEGGIVRFFNKSAEERFGWKADEIINQKIDNLMPEEHAIKHDSYLKHYYNTGENRVIGKDREIVAKMKNNTLFPIRLWISEVMIHDQRLFVAAIRDMTEVMQIRQLTKDVAASQAKCDIPKTTLEAIGVSRELNEKIKRDLYAMVTLNKDSQQQVELGSHYLDQSQAKISQVKETSNQTILGLEKLEQSINTIWDVVAIINSIADQTKIIAFNAELEASSAGEAGKNFQIVATEIRRLADHTTTSVREIRSKIDETQRSSTHLVELVQQETKEIQEGWKLIEDTREIFNLIQSASTQTASATANISSLSAKQDQTMNALYNSAIR